MFSFILAPTSLQGTTPRLTHWCLVLAPLEHISYMYVVSMQNYTKIVLHNSRIVGHNWNS